MEGKPSEQRLLAFYVITCSSFDCLAETVPCLESVVGRKDKQGIVHKRVFVHRSGDKIYNDLYQYLSSRRTVVEYPVNSLAVGRATAAPRRLKCTSPELSHFMSALCQVFIFLRQAGALATEVKTQPRFAPALIASSFMMRRWHMFLCLAQINRCATGWAQDGRSGELSLKPFFDT